MNVVGRYRGLIHWSEMLREMQERDSEGRYVAFECWYAKMNGELKRYVDCRLSSIHFKGDTVNVIVGNDRQPKTFKKLLIVGYNGQRVYV